MLFDDIKKDMTESLKKGDKVRVNTLRFLIAAIRNQSIAKYGAAAETSLTDEDVLDTIKKQVKTHKESVEAFEHAGRAELAQTEKDELAILSAFLPKELTDDALRSMLHDIAVSGEQNFGLLMRTAMAKVGGQADGGRVSAILRELMATNK